MPGPPVDPDLSALADRFEQADRRVRVLVAAAPEGDRRALLTEALLILTGLRRQVAAAGTMIEFAFVVAALAVDLLQGRPAGRVELAPVRDLAGSLTKQLDLAVRSAQTGSRGAFRTVTAETVAQGSQDAVTALVDRTGARRSLGAHAATLTETIGSHALSRGTADRLGPGGLVTISTHDTKNPICRPREGKTLPAQGKLPPYHPRCEHVATPAGHTTEEHVEALQAARKRAYAQFYASRR